MEKHSALLETNHEEQIPVDADHSSMCKFETDSNDTFEKVYKRPKRIMTLARKIEQLKQARIDRDKLQNSIFQEKVRLEIEHTGPRLVCNDHSYKEVRDDGTGSGVILPIYKACHEPYFYPVLPDTFADSEVIKHPPFNGNEDREVCGHSWEVHLNVNSKTELRKRWQKDTAAEEMLAKLTSDIRVMEATIENLKS